MKKKIISVILILLFAVVLFAACNGNDNSGGNTDDIELSSAMFVNCRVDLTGTQGFGIVEKNEALTQNKNYMVNLNEDGTLNDVVFLSDANEEIKQEQIAGQIDKLHITEKFTFMMFVKTQSVTRDENFDINGYKCDTNNQSFIIDNATGKIYSLEQLCSDKLIMVTENYVILYPSDGSPIENGKPFALEVQNGNLVFTDLLPNPSISYQDIVCDKFGNYYVAVYAPDEKIDNIFYYNYLGGTLWTGIKYCKGNDGYVYKVTITERFDFNGKCSIKRMGSKFEEISLESNTIVVIDFDFETKIVIKEEKLSYIYFSTVCFADYNNGEYIQNGRASFGGNFTAFLETEFFYISNTMEDNKKLYHYDLFTKTKTLLLDGVSELKTEGTKLYAYVEIITGTKKYNITFNEWQAEYTLVSDTAYDRIIITIQPLN